MKYLKNFNENNIPTLIDADKDGSVEVDLDVDDIQLSEGVLYEFLEVHFNIKYNSVNNNYHAILQYPDVVNGIEQYIGWVLYAKTIQEMTKKLRFQIKMYIKQFGKN